MARQEIILGTPPSGLGGDPPRVASQKINHMTQELYDEQAKLGTAAVADVQITASDLAAGKVLVVGAAGWNGGFAIVKGAGTDLNTLSISGLYACNSTHINGPAAAYGSWPIYVRVSVHGAGYIKQEVLGLTSAVSADRVQANGVWSPWETNYNSANAVGSVEGGAIIERGANANGEFTKFADGTLITRGVKLINAAVSAGASITWLGGSDLQPSPFVGLPIHSINVGFWTGANGTGAPLYGALQSYPGSGTLVLAVLNTGVAPSASHPNFTVGAQAAASYLLHFKSIGRWR